MPDSMANGVLVGERVLDQVVLLDKLRPSGPVPVYDATPIRREPTRQAVEDPWTWLVGASTETEASDSQQ